MDLCQTRSCRCRSIMGTFSQSHSGKWIWIFWCRSLSLSSRLTSEESLPNNIWWLWSMRSMIEIHKEGIEELRWSCVTARLSNLLPNFLWGLKFRPAFQKTARSINLPMQKWRKRKRPDQQKLKLRRYQKQSLMSLLQYLQLLQFLQCLSIPQLIQLQLLQP